MQSKLRIPRVATAMLVLGGACDDDKESSPLDAAGIDASEQRQGAVAEALCKVLIDCEGASASLLPTCKANTIRDFEDYAEAGVDDDCMDALLDYYGCYATLSCEELDPDDESDAIAECERAARLEARCEGQLPDEG